MSRVLRTLRRFAADTRGATMAEYAVLLAVIAIVVILGAKALGGSVSDRLTTAATNIGNL
jgi:Flp pilus assembly pilin Flp